MSSLRIPCSIEVGIHIALVLLDSNFYTLMFFYFPVKQTTFTCHRWTSKDLTKMGPRPSVATEKYHCEKNLGFKFSHGDVSKAPGCGTCWCCRPNKGNFFPQLHIFFLLPRVLDFTT